jgi:hypothetical protein
VAILVHEVWEEVCDGMALHTCCVAGPRGDGCRRNLEPGARLLTTFEAGSHLEAMTTDHRYLGRGEFTTVEPWGHQPYPDEWRAEQQRQAEPFRAPDCGGDDVVA